MTDLQTSLIKNLSNSSEQLVLHINVTVPSKPKKRYILCIGSQAGGHVHNLWYFKLEGKSKFLRKKNTWPLSNIQRVESIDGQKFTFDLTIGGRPFSWTAESHSTRQEFLSALHKFAQQNNLATTFANMPFTTDTVTRPARALTAVHPENFYPNNNEPTMDETMLTIGLSEPDEADLSEVLKLAEKEVSVTDLRATAQKHISLLDRTVVKSLVDAAQMEGQGNGPASAEKLLETSSGQVDESIRRFDRWINSLQAIQRDCELMKNRAELDALHSKNLTKLEQTLRVFVDALTIDQRQIDLIELPRTESRIAAEDSIRAASHIEKSLQFQTISPAFANMAAFKEQKQLFEDYLEKFRDGVVEIIRNSMETKAKAIVRLADDNFQELRGSWSTAGTGADSKSSLSNLFQQLHQPFRVTSAYNRWLLANQTRYAADLRRLSDQYLDAMSQSYGHLVAVCFGEFRRQIGQIWVSSADGLGVGRSKAAKTSFYLQPDQNVSWREGGSSASPRTASVSSVEASGVSPLTRFDMVFAEQVLRVVHEICVGEEQFFRENFEPAEGQRDWFGRQLFAGVANGLCGIMDDGCSRERLCALVVYIRTFEEKVSVSDTLYDNQILKECLLHAKRQFNKLRDSITTDFSGQRLTKKGVHLAPFLHQFEEFVRLAQALFHGSSQFSDVEKTYLELCSVMFEHIPKLDSSKIDGAPPVVVQMENYYKLTQILKQLGSSLKIRCFDEQSKKSRTLYKTAENNYVGWLLANDDHNFRKVKEFFEAINQLLVDDQLPPNEVSYRKQYSRDEAQKILHLVSKKKLNEMLRVVWKLIEKHISKDNELLKSEIMVVVQREFFASYDQISGTVRKCYGHLGVYMEVTQDDINQMIQGLRMS